MEDAILFDIVMRTIWGDDDPEPGAVARAIVNKVRGTQALNHENACDVLRAIWPHATCTPRLIAEPQVHTYEKIIFDVKFEDGSAALIVADKYGQGSAVETL